LSIPGLVNLLQDLDQAGDGQAGVILRREGLYSSHLTEWRRAREAGALKGLSKKRGRKGKPQNPLQGRVAQLERQLAMTQEKLRKAELILEVQGKVSELLGIDLKSGKDS
ncbi:MAG: IS3 family transposase, partial [Acidobacteria bacterium]|nr:IS3 family transposase [Acidobacteriota bacterium]